MTCRNCLDDPCTCPAKPAKPVREFHLRECLVEGCHVVIRTAHDADHGPAFCKWHQDGEVHVTKARTSSDGPLMTKDDFGVALFDAVKICGGILQLQDLQQTANPKRLPDYQQREQIMMQQLAALVPKLSVSDQEALLERYPRLFA